MTTQQLTRAPWLDWSLERLVRVVWLGRSKILSLIGLFGVIGVLVALLTSPEFVSEAKIMPEMNSGSGDMLKRLASMTGFSGMDFSGDEGIDAVRPDLYPTVLQSTPFILYLINQPVATSTGDRQTIGQILLPENSWSLHHLFLGGEPKSQKPLIVKPNEPVQLTPYQQDLADDISKRVSAKLDTRSGVITITAKMPDARVAATVAQLAMDYLTQYVTSYRTEKARQDLRFYAQRLNEVRQRYQAAQLNVFHYNDQHKYFVVQAATMDKQRLEAELTIAQTVYTELSRQFEQAKLKVQERTPVFKVLEPAQVPLKRVSPKRTVIVLLFSLAGLVVSVVYLVARQADWIGQLWAMVEDK